MLNEEKFEKGVYEYAKEKYSNSDSQKNFEKWIDEFPERNWTLPGSAWQNNFSAWILFEKVLPQTNMTIAEEFATNSSEVSTQLKERIFQIRKNIIRSEFVVISRQENILKLKVFAGKEIYFVKIPDQFLIKPNMLLNCRIFPFGEYYRVMGVMQIRQSPLILDPEVMSDFYDQDQIKNIENIKLLPGSSSLSIMEKYPAQWIDCMCKRLRINARVKTEKIKSIMRKLYNETSAVMAELPDKSKEVLRICIKNNGFVKYGELRDYDDHIRFFFEDDKNISTIGELRYRGMLIVGKLPFGSKWFKVAFIPVELREKFKENLKL